MSDWIALSLFRMAWRSTIPNTSSAGWHTCAAPSAGFPVASAAAKAATLVAKAHRKIRNQRAAFHHDLSRWLVERYGLIAVEDLNIKGLSRGILAGPVHDAGWNSFFAKRWYKAASAGRELVKVNPRGTSQVCVCGAAVPKTLAECWHECPVCGFSAPRDVVSAQVILQPARIGRSRHNVEDVVSCVRRVAVAFHGVSRAALKDRRRSDQKQNEETSVSSFWAFNEKRFSSNYPGMMRGVRKNSSS